MLFEQLINFRKVTTEDRSSRSNYGWLVILSNRLLKKS